MSDSQDNLEAIFEAALGLPAEERAAYLDGACDSDEALRQRVERLLRNLERAGNFLTQGEEPLKRALPATVTTEKPGDHIGRYKLLQQIGEGGCGVVYMAEQEEPVRRRVALKVIKLGMDTKSVIARFEAERQALAMMDHPNIAKVYDAGATETGRPYFVMELVRGVKITDYCDEKSLSTSERLELFSQVCHAIQHAHQKGIIHRDIKPSNVLVSVNDGVAVPKVIDFGIAKATTEQRLTDKTVFTAFEQFIGTPAYVSPEQAEVSNVDVDTRSDIYSLGVLLYELLTGKTPFDAKELLQAGLDKMRRTIREKEPERPSTRVSTLGGEELTTAANRRGVDAPKLVNVLRGDLDWIVMKCLEKDRARRYETANGLAMDIQRHLTNEPVVACPPSTFYRFQKTVRRNKLAFAAAGAVGAALAVGLGLALWQFAQKAHAYKRAVAAEKSARTEAANSRQVAQFLKSMLKGLGPSVGVARDTALLGQILDKTAARTAEDLTNQPLVALELRTTIAATYGDLGLFDRMEELARQNLKLAQALLGGKNTAVADALYQIGEAEMYRSNLEEAESFAREALLMRRTLFGSEHPDVARSLLQLGGILHLKGKTADAEACLRQSLAMQNKLLGDEHPDVADALEGLAVELRRVGTLAEAETSIRKALDIRRKFVGNEHPSVGGTLDILGMVLKERAERGEPGKLAEAETVYREAVEMLQKLLGKDHFRVASALGGLGSVLLLEGRIAEAESALRESIAIQRGAFGDGSLTLAWDLQSLGRVLERQEKWAEAQASYREAYLARRRASVAPHLFVSLPRVLRKQGRDSEAEAIEKDAIKANEIAAEAGDVDAQRELAWVFSTSPNPKLRNGRQAVMLAERAVAASNRKNADYLDILAAAYAEDGQFDKGIATEREAMALDPGNNDFELRLKLYESKSPYRDNP